jgi:hypothetical protein
MPVFHGPDSAGRSRRPAFARRLAATAALSAAPVLAGCATLAGLPFSPITGAVGGVVHNESTGWDVVWGYPLGVVAGVLWGPVMALSIGISADVGFAGHGAYGAEGSPDFLDVFDPYGYCLTRPPRPDERPKP